MKRVTLDRRSRKDRVLGIHERFPTNELREKLTSDILEADGDADTVLKGMDIVEYLPSDEVEALEEKINGISPGDQEKIDQLVQDIKQSVTRSKLPHVSAGKRKIRYHWWGLELYLSHKDLKRVSSPETTTGAAFLGVMFPGLGAIAAVLSLFLYRMIKADKGNGSTLYLYIPDGDSEVISE